MAAGDRLRRARLIVERLLVRIRTVIQTVQVGIIQPNAARVRPAHDEENGQAEYDTGAEQSGYDGADEEPGLGFQMFVIRFGWFGSDGAVRMARFGWRGSGVVWMIRKEV